MATVTLILGTSGSGKSTSLRNLNPEDVALIQVLSKPLPFKSAGWTPYRTDDWSKIIVAAQQAAAKGRKIIVIDDFQYLLANEFMRRTDERGYDKFTEIGRHAWEVIAKLVKLGEDIRVYVLSHTEETDGGRIKMKTIGKMLDDKITLEGMVTIVLRSIVQDRNFLFSTINNGSDTVKAPMGMFDSDLIDNDLAAVDAAICSYYDIQPSKAA
ncbi:AAA family ATPase [Pseudomonas aeruginosa]|uniref:AAA family ATPase n=1 Tax=Pseudomonas aeruginosa group TaxID=136841 RepID=UPI001C66E718|nr:AAA family ATPase [Pseudomonas aeruginosa]MBW6333081.1 ATP-binding protein [Pseudomonas aeruginosa]MCM8592256.1 ATP-binding protein [Pseudomonas aeruginosa]MCM8676167.1 ATP-binding protein [Pseudomonas aeruginosa]MCP2656114.1 ATP-binding protein [Pseudomonas aeruginosa]MDI3856361.1 AAA family ATPase [Pseudomonas aeruginosa]